MDSTEVDPIADMQERIRASAEHALESREGDHITVDDDEASVTLRRKNGEFVASMPLAAYLRLRLRATK